MRSRLPIIKLLFWVTLAVFLLCLGNISRAEAELTQDQQKLKEAKETERKLLDELDELGRKMESVELRMARIQSEITALKKRLPIEKRELKALKNAQNKTKHLLYRRLRAIYRRREGGMMQVLLNSSSIPDLVHRYRYMAAIIAHDEAMLREFDQRARDIRAKMDLIKSQEAGLKQLLAQIKMNREKLVHLQRQKTSFLMKVHQRKQTYLALIRAREASREKLIKEVIIKPEQKVARKNSVPVSISKADERPRQWPDFASRKGRLPRPVDGRITDHFGRNPGLFGTYTQRQGISILARSGSSVRAIADGEVLFANWLKGYGNVIIINHGKRYYTLTAGITRIKPKVGQWVHRGDLLGLVPDGGKKGKKGIYLEIRYRGKALDPGIWLGSTLAAQTEPGEKKDVQ